MEVPYVRNYLNKFDYITPSVGWTEGQLNSGFSYPWDESKSFLGGWNSQSFKKAEITSSSPHLAD